MTFLNALIMIVMVSAVSGVAIDELIISKNCTQGFCGIKPEGYDALQEQMNSLLPDFLKKTYADRTNDIADLPKRETESDGCVVEYLYEAFAVSYKKENWDIIVQTDQFKQHFEIVRCAQESINIVDEPQCSPKQKTNGYIGKCITTYAPRKIYVFDTIKKELQLVKYDVPVCCSCQFFTPMFK